MKHVGSPCFTRCIIPKLVPTNTKENLLSPGQSVVGEPAIEVLHECPLENLSCRSNLNLLRGQPL